MADEVYFFLYFVLFLYYNYVELGLAFDLLRELAGNHREALGIILGAELFVVVDEFETINAFSADSLGIARMVIAQVDIDRIENCKIHCDKLT